MRLGFSIYRYNPDADGAPYVQDYALETEESRDIMLLDALIQLKEKDLGLSFRCSCRGSVRDSDGLSTNGKDGLACITPTSVLNQPGRKVVIRPLPGLPVIRDLVVSIGQFYVQYGKIKSYLLNNGQNLPVRKHLQMLEQCEKLDGLYECILYACYSTSCLSFWRNPDKLIGPAGLLAVYHLLIDSRGTEADSRLDGLSDTFSVFRCYSIMDCISVYPKRLNPMHATDHIKLMLLQHNAQAQAR